MKTTKTLTKKLTIAEFASAIKDAPDISDKGYDEYIAKAVKRFSTVKIPTNKELEQAFGSAFAKESCIGRDINWERNKEDIIFFETLRAERVSAGTDFESPETFRSLGFQSKDGNWINGGCKF